METEPRAHILQMGAQNARDQLTQQRSRTLFNGQTEVGRTDHVIVYSDGTAQGDATAQAILRTVEADYAATQGWFGGIELPPGQEGDDQTTPRTATPVQVLIDSQAGGAYHFGCNATDIYVEPTPELGNGFFVAELVEIFEATINNGWDCGQTNGEGLSRVLAGERNSNLGSLFVQTEQSWWANGHANYISDNSADDTNQDANGCATLFLYYLHSQLGYDWRTITTTGGATLADTYQRLTGKDPAAGVNDFLAQLATLDTGGLLNVPGSGNPFPIGAVGAPAQQQQPSAGQGEPAPVGSTAYGSAPDGAMAEGGAPDDATDAAPGGVDVVERHVEVYELAPEDGGADQGQPVYKVYETEVETQYPPAPNTPDAGAPNAPAADADAFDRTAPIKPRGLSSPADAYEPIPEPTVSAAPEERVSPAARPAPYVQVSATPKRGEGLETMIGVVVVLIVLVLLFLLTVLFTSGIVHL